MHLQTYFDILRARGVPVDVAHPDDDLGAYDSVVAPTLYLVDDGWVARLESYVRDGGHLLVSIRMGCKDRYDRVYETPRPGPMRSLVGATVEEHETVTDALDTFVSYEGNHYNYRTWGEWLTPNRPESWARIGAESVGARRKSRPTMSASGR
ncbi:beta-galactosidase trimerization domain-containing protein [Halorhabdus amylolytica]|uniref:beta-galactosidase trimerization domain-containing protein n=1 Tax=Halorhabdus amylolytica TaxID=2559573 RepID=UPI001B7D7BC0|nr:beta-galactosidase trimerization domain-containing protein [Halorhabdus amylolytica]